jgi:hypothetical protein
MPVNEEGMGSPMKYERIHCNNCGPDRKHELIQSRKHYGSDDHSDVSWQTASDMLECCACQEITLRHRFYFSEWEANAVETTFYPPRIARRLPPWKDKLPLDMVSLLEEVYKALQADSKRLAMMSEEAGVPGSLACPRGTCLHAVGGQDRQFIESGMESRDAQYLGTPRRS